MISEEYTLGFDAFLRSFKQNIDSSFTFLLGAGASVSSGIQLASACIWDWKTLLYQSYPNNKQIINPKYSDISKDVIQRWLETKGFIPEQNEDEYSYYAEKAFPIDEDRKQYFFNLVCDKSPYVGYKLLCLLHKFGYVNSIWSTNFDGLVERAAQQENITPININPDCINRIYQTENQKQLLYIALHGDYKYSSLKNTAKELDSQEVVFAKTLKNYFINRNLIVFGYSGRDKSLMTALSSAFSEPGAGRLYWCGCGKEIEPPVCKLILEARKAGRIAYYINTDGFDKTMISVMNYSFNDNVDKKTAVNTLLSSIPQKEEEKNQPFTIDRERTSLYLKSNLFPIIFPKQVFQFEIKTKSIEGVWKFLREKTEGNDIVAIPFKGKVYSFSTLSIIEKVFGSYIQDNIERVPFTKETIERNSVFKELLLDAVLYGISKRSGLKVFKNKSQKMLWDERIINRDRNITVHEAMECALYFLPKEDKYALLSLKPSLFFLSKEKVSKEIKQKYSRLYFDNMRNKDFDAKIEMWVDRIFGNLKLCFNIPYDTASPFEFSISKNRAYAEIKDDNFSNRLYSPKEYNQKQTIYSGIAINEPSLRFSSSFPNKYVTDTNPMRGLLTNKPIDYNFFNQKDIRFGVLCPDSYSSVFYSFLNRLNITSYVDAKSDYVQDYTGFENIYGASIDIPNINSERWKSLCLKYNSAYDLAETLCNYIRIMADLYPRIIVIIFIPNIWSEYRQVTKDGEVFDLHNYIKAFAAQQGVTTQLVEEKTIYDKMQCQISWWLSLALFVKAFRTPWSLAEIDSDTAFAGIGYSIKSNRNGTTNIVLGCSHIYNSKGQGLKYKLSKVEHPFFDKKKNPYLNFEDAFKFGVTIRELFETSMEKLPQRVVIHKRTPFKDEEIEGITSSLKQAGINRIDLVTINYEENLKFLKQNVYYGKLETYSYPVDRGTCIIISSKKALLWTHGVIPSIKNPQKHYYPGGRCIPSPLVITRYYGNSELRKIAGEIIGFTKMNWNSFNFYTKLPATIDTSNTLAQIGNLLNCYNGITYDYRYFI